MTRAKRIRNCIPSKLTITVFGIPKISDTEPVEKEAAPNASPNANPDLQSKSPDVPQESAIRVQSIEQLPMAVSQRTPNETCEGWAPPPIALHGPKFRILDDTEKSELIKLHKNLGHPDPERLAQHLSQQGADPKIVAAAREFVCDACVESTSFRHQRPAQLHDPQEFNNTVGVDGFFWSGRGGFQVMVFHCIDESSLFHLGRRLSNRNLEHVIPAFTDMWFAWAGSPSNLYSDPAGEFCSDEWLSFLQSHNIIPKLSTEAWQKGRVERHGAIIKEMLTRFDIEKCISSPQEFDLVLKACFSAKNSLSRHRGYAPEQIVLGKSTKLPASLTADENLGAHCLASGNDLESERFRQQLEIRSLARKTFVHADNSQAIRRALLRRSCPSRGPFQVGQQVMYWRHHTKANRREGDRWHGPARIISQENSTTVWVVHAHRVLRCSPESLRPASIREWQGTVDPLGPLIQQQQDLLKPLAGTPEHPIELDSPGYSPSMAPVMGHTPVSQQSGLQPESEQFPENQPFSRQETSEAETPQDYQITESQDNVHEPVQQENESNVPVPAEDDESLLSESILTCQEVLHQDRNEPVYDWITFQTGESSAEVCLAEDGFPFLDEPLEHGTEQCFMLEVPMSRQDVLKWSQSTNYDDMACVASASKRARAEVQLKDLTANDQKLFDIAKDAELTCWIQTSALKPILRKSLNPEQILKSRWVLTWKPIEGSDGQMSGRKAKARLVVLGYMDPRLTEVARDAPTLTREGRHTILQAIASYQWLLSSFDIRTAFLRGKADDANPLAMEPPKELRQKLGLSDSQVCALIGNAYGRVDAPLLFYRELLSQLQKLGFKTHPLEPCIQYLESWTNGKRTLHGILGTHVDDGICGGDQVFHQKLEALKKQLPFGSFKQRKFIFTGIQLEQLPDHSILASQQDYVHSIIAIEVGKHRRSCPEQPASDAEKSALRGLIRSVQYAVTHTRPDLASKLGEI